AGRGLGRALLGVEVQHDDARRAGGGDGPVDRLAPVAVGVAEAGREVDVAGGRHGAVVDDAVAGPEVHVAGGGADRDAGVDRDVVEVRRGGFGGGRRDGGGAGVDREGDRAGRAQGKDAGGGGRDPVDRGELDAAGAGDPLPDADGPDSALEGEVD